MARVLPEIAAVTSESLQQKIRELLPSQNGFGSDLCATNVIQPIIDMTASAAGATTPEILQTAISYGSITSFDVNNTTTTLANTAGFWKVFYNFTGNNNASNSGEASFSITDGLSTKQIIQQGYVASGLSTPTSFSGEFVVFLRSGDSLTTTCTNSAFSRGCYFQIADVNGDLVYPSGFTPQ